jgi:hypothetical protein
MEKHAKRVCELAEDAANAEDGLSALRTLTELRDETEELAKAHVQRALVSGQSFAEVARALGITRQAAHRRYRHLAPERTPEPPRRLIATAGAREAVRLARERAVAAGEPLRAKHLLLGVLGTDTDAARALRAEGVTLESASACARATVADGDDGPASLRRILRQAGQVALARGDERLGPEQLLLAVLGDADDGARGTLAALGVTPASIRKRLGC